MKKMLMGIAILGSSLFLSWGQNATLVPDAAAAIASPNPAALPDEAQLFLDNPGQEADAGAPSVNNGDTGFGFWDLLRMVLVLALVAGAIYGLLVLVRKRKGKPGAETRLITVLGSQGLPGNRWVHLVAVQNQVFLLGSAEQSVNLIAEITDENARNELVLMGADEENRNGPKSFTDILGSVYTQVFGGKPRPGLGGSAQVSGLEDKKQRLRRL